MTLLLAADIFGATPELLALAARLHATFAVVAPHAGPAPDFANEDEAYSAFLAAGGIDAYAAIVSGAIARHRPDAIMGFSAGATAAWIAMAGQAASVKLGVLFYGSRIRDHLHLRPRAVARLIFAEHEKGCDAAALAGMLRRRGVDADIVPGTRHGFMNPRSSGFDAVAMECGVRTTKELLRLFRSGPGA
jgi:dienelactone hydrolase